MVSKKTCLSLGARIKIGFAVPQFLLLLIMAGVYSIANQVTQHASSTGTAKYAALAQQMRLDVVQVQQWLTDISATRAQDGLNDGFDEAQKHAQSFLACLAEFRHFYESTQHRDHLRQIGRLETAFNDYYEVGKKMAQGYIEGGPKLGNQLMGEFDETSARLAGISSEFIDYHTEALNQDLASIVSSSKLLLSTVIIVGVSALVLGFFMAWFVTRSIMRPLNGIIGRLWQGAKQLESASNQISASAQSLAEGSTEQAAGLEETSSSLEEMASMTRQNADNAQQANTLVSEARRAADTGTESMTRMNTAICDIQQRSGETAKIINVIDEIAFQTNLLALNAAVEAARAGEAGKGFAVVAEEVRNLAMRSAEAAKNTAMMIDGSVKSAGHGVEIAADVAKVLEEIVQSIHETTDLVSEIAIGSSEQAEGIDQLNTAVAQMDTVTQQNAANAEESASAAEELHAQAESINAVVNQLASLVGGVAGRNRQERNYERVGTRQNNAAALQVKAAVESQFRSVLTEDLIRNGGQ